MTTATLTSTGRLYSPAIGPTEKVVQKAQVTDCPVALGVPLHADPPRRVMPPPKARADAKDYFAKSSSASAPAHELTQSRLPRMMYKQRASSNLVNIVHCLEETSIAVAVADFLGGRTRLLALPLTAVDICLLLVTLPVAVVNLWTGVRVLDGVPATVRRVPDSVDNLEEATTPRLP